MRKKTEKQHRQNGHFRRLCLALAACLLVLSAFGLGTAAARALENEKSTAVRSVHMQDSQIEEATLVIGSHLIHISALTDELYQIALDSASEFSQSGMYYKSELADGTWYEISEASSIGDITTAGTPVSKTVIEALEFTHQTKADGVTIDLRTGAAVSVFDIQNPYDLRTMEELEPLRIQYQILQEKTDKNESDKIYLDMLDTFFATDIQSDVTRECDASLRALESYQSGLSAREKAAQWTEQVEKTMSAVDADRRVDSLTTLETCLDTLENDASGMKQKEESEEDTSEEETTPPDFVINSEIISAVGDCIQNVQESISTYAAKQIAGDGGTVSSETEYRYRQELTAGARSGDTAASDRALEKLCDLQNILGGVVAQEESERNTLTSELVSAAFDKYTSALKEGVSQEYREQSAMGAALALRVKCLSRQKSAANAKRLEYQDMLEALFIRMENGAAQEYVLRLIDGVEDLENSVVRDTAAIYLLDTVAEHRIWLRKEYADLVKNASDSTEMSKLEEEKAELEREQQDALDNNDLALAKQLSAQMEAKQKDIDQLAGELTDILNSESSSEADKARAAAALGEKNTAALLVSMSDDLTAAIRGADSETRTEDLQNRMAALTAASTLDPKAAKAALKQVKEAVENAAELDADLAEELTEQLADALETAEEAGTDPLTEEALESLLDNILTELYGDGFEKVSEKQQAAAMIAMEWYGQEQELETALQLAAALAGDASRRHNPYLYSKYTDKTENYISLQALGEVSGYRYIFDDAHATVTLHKAKLYYRFTLSEQTYQAADGTDRELSAKPKLMETMYLSGTDSRLIFSVEAEYFEKSSLGAVGTPEVEALAEDVYERLLEGGE